MIIIAPANVLTPKRVSPSAATKLIVPTLYIAQIQSGQVICRKRSQVEERSLIVHMANRWQHCAVWVVETAQHISVGIKFHDEPIGDLHQAEQPLLAKDLKHWQKSLFYQFKKQKR